MAKIINYSNNPASSPNLAAISCNSFLNSILGNSLGFYTANLTKNIIEHDFVPVQLKDSSFSVEHVGLKIPCNLDEFYNAWKKQMCDADQPETSLMKNRRLTLIESYNKGEYIKSAYFWTKDIKGSRYYVSEDIILTKEDNGDIYGTFIMRDATTARQIEELELETEKIAKKQLKERLRSAKMIQALSDDYESVYYVDLEGKEMFAYRLSPAIEKEYGELFRSGKITYDQAFDAYIDHTVFEDDKLDMHKAVTPKKLIEKFDVKKVYTKDYRVFRNGTISFCQMKIANLSYENGHHCFLFGFSDISDTKEQELERYAYVDPLTGGDNYYKFKKRLADCSKTGYIVSLDISSFKIINSVCGVKKGDQTLKYLWEFVRTGIKPSDYAGHVYADRFVLFLPERTEQEVIEITRTITHMLQFLTVDMEVPQLIPYFGIAKMTPGDELEEIYSRSIAAKKKVKDRKDINYAFFNQADTEIMYNEKRMEDDFEQALQTGQFEIWLQPKFTPVVQDCVGAEALVRWRKPDGKLVPPGDFIPLFEKNGLIRTLDEYVFRKVCLIQKDWINLGREPLPISVNLSRASLYYNTVVDQYKWITEQIGINPQFVPIEITESAAVSNSDIKAIADKFYMAGFPLHMDDFGSGYSSLASLNTMHFETLKIDKSLIDYIGNYSGDRLLVHTIALAKELGMHITAEGVEDQKQVNFLKELNCDSIQGFVYSKPLPLKEFKELYNQDKPAGL